MEKVIVEIYAAGHNYCAHAPILPGCISTASSLEDIKNNIKLTIELHVESALRKNDPVPEVFKEEYELDFIILTEQLIQVNI